MLVGMSRRAGMLIAAVAGLGLGGAATGCGGHAGDVGPAWPKSAGHVVPDSWEDDGGESLAPHQAAAVAAVEASADEPVEAEDPIEIDDVPAVDDDAPVDDDDGAVDDVYIPDETIIIEGDLPPDDDDGDEP